MHPTLLVGDRVISLKFSTKHIFCQNKIGVNHDDIIVFYPTENSTSNVKQIKRCIGIPGDTIEIVHGSLFRNGNHVKLLNSIYRKDLNITCETDFRIRFLENVKLFPNNDEIKFSVLNFGPVIIPKANTVVELTHENWIMYNKVIREEEDTATDSAENHFFDDSWEQGKYRFQKDYFFVIGDNYFNSIDSRYWGFLPEEMITGKVVCILFSIDDKSDYSHRRIRKRFLYDINSK